jgi:hypothetical protein
VVGRSVQSIVKQRAVKWAPSDRGCFFVVRAIPDAELIACHGHMRHCVWGWSVFDEIPHKLLDVARLIVEKSRTRMSRGAGSISTNHPGPLHLRKRRELRARFHLVVGSVVLRALDSAVARNGVARFVCRCHRVLRSGRGGVIPSRCATLLGPPMGVPRQH